MPDIKSMTIEELTELVSAMGEKPFRAKQLFAWMHVNRVRTYDEMRNLPGALRSRLAKEKPLLTVQAVQVQESARGDTRKYLFALHDGNMIESVWMRHRHGISVCISSQVGCRMGCRFCASTLDGCVRNLTASEMLEQIYEIQRLTGERVSHIDVMGSGEPLDNYDTLLRWIRLVSHPDGICISQRNITVSTCGLVPQIRKLAREKFGITLAISLHAPDDLLRQELMPVARRYSIEELTAACREYFAETGRRISFEYALIAGKNDGAEHAEKLAKILKGMNCHVNLIPVNPVKERNYSRSAAPEVRNFQIKLENYGINVTIRREMGADIDGACGQLRKRYQDAQNCSGADVPESRGRADHPGSGTGHP
ncbi:MAG: 23S rRNA (adenine(2503)-C(2))-methyltransferase RlmN [Eubacterium sp.]|nr:23S rRNA (adenine(2503)-C(2))-methyltransferase RlmN [Eubacterium sp.]